MSYLHRKRFQAVALFAGVWAYARREADRLRATAARRPPEPGETSAENRLTEYERGTLRAADKLAEEIQGWLDEVVGCGVANLADDLSQPKAWPDGAGVAVGMQAFFGRLSSYEGRDVLAELTAVRETLEPILKTFNLQTGSTTRLTDAIGP